MKSKSLGAVLVLVFLALAFAAPAGAEAGKVTPVIHEAFASKEITTGDTWKIYLKASNPNGEIKRIFAMIYQPGVGEYPLSILRVRSENRKEMSGFLSLSTAMPYYPVDFLNLTLTVHLQDTSGAFSQAVVFPLYISSRSAQDLPPQGIFKEVNLGALPILLKRTDGNGGTSGSGFGD